MKKFLFIITMLFFCNVHANEQDAKQFIDNLANQALGILKNNSNAQIKEQKLTNLFENNVDITWLGDFALGKHKRNLSPEEYKNYHQHYHKFLLNSYIPNFKKYNNNDVKITQVKAQSNNEYLVRTEIMRANGSPIKVDYMIREKNGVLKIFDIIGENVSIASTERSEFGSIISERGLSSLLKELQSKANN